MIRFVDKDAAVKDDHKIILFGGKRSGAMSDAETKKTEKTELAKKEKVKAK